MCGAIGTSRPTGPLCACSSHQETVPSMLCVLSASVRDRGVASLAGCAADMKPPTFSSTDLQLLRRQLNSWRGQQSGSHRLPPELWTAAATLAATHGVSRVSRILRLGFHRLRHQCQEPPPSSPRTPPPARFLEVKVNSACAPGGPAIGWVELVNGPHQRMRVHTGHDPAAWVALARAFWENDAS